MKIITLQVNMCLESSADEIEFRHQQNLIFVAEKPEKPVLWGTIEHYVVLHNII